MDHDEPVPEADAIEQSEEPGDTPELPGDMGERPEADALDQARPVNEVRVRVVPPARDDVPEADWLEQSAVEPVEDDEPR